MSCPIQVSNKGTGKLLSTFTKLLTTLHFMLLRDCSQAAKSHSGSTASIPPYGSRQEDGSHRRAAWQKFAVTEPQGGNNRITAITATMPRSSQDQQYLSQNDTVVTALFSQSRAPVTARRSKLQTQARNPLPSCTLLQSSDTHVMSPMTSCSRPGCHQHRPLRSASLPPALLLSLLVPMAQPTSHHDNPSLAD